MNPEIAIVGGCGHVGLPLGLVFAGHGRHVTLLDIDHLKVEQINAGLMPFREKGADALLGKVIGKTLRATLDPECLHTAEIVISVVGTPVDKHLNPTVNDLYNSVDQLLIHMRDGALLILRSTVYPGVTKLV